MSYKLRVLSDDPLGYWRLYQPDAMRYNDPSITYDDPNATYDEGFYYRLDDETQTANAAIIPGGSVPIFTDTFPLVSFSSSDQNINAAKINDNSVISIRNSYKNFYSGYENSTFGIEFWMSLPYNTPSDLILIHGYHSANQIFKIYVNNDTMYFSLTTNNGTYITKKQMISWDQKVHVFAVYKDRTIKLFINALSDEMIEIPKTHHFATAFADTTSIEIGPSNAGTNFRVSDLAFYDKELSVNEMRSHMSWASRDSDPVNYAHQENTSYFTFDENSGTVLTQQKFLSKQDYDQGFYENLIQDGNGLTIPQDKTSNDNATGIWTYNFPIVQYQDFAGISISWDTGSSNASTISNKYVAVYASYDDGATYYQVKSNEVVPYFLSTASDITSSKLLLRVQIYSPDISVSNQPRLDNLSVKIYSSLDVISDSGHFIFSPLHDSYLIRQNSNSMLDKSRNFGVYFEKQDPAIGKTGAALITSVDSIPYYGLEFWFKYEEDNNATYATLVDTPGVQGADLYLDVPTSTLISALDNSGDFYVNGVKRSPETYVIVPGEIYHIVLNYFTAKTNPIHINDSIDGLSDSMQAIYGFITLFHDPLTDEIVQNRYLSYLTTSVQAFNDSSSTTIGTINEYLGVSSATNGGNSISYNEHIN
jgi:hypothetical protein